METPADRSTPKAVAGCLSEMSPELLKELRKAVVAVEKEPKIPYNATPVIRNSVIKRHNERKASQLKLRATMDKLIDHPKFKNLSDSECQRLFYMEFGIDILSAEALNKKDSDILTSTIDTFVNTVII